MVHTEVRAVDPQLFSSDSELDGLEQRIGGGAYPQPYASVQCPNDRIPIFFTSGLGHGQSNDKSLSAWRLLR